MLSLCALVGQAAGAQSPTDELHTAEQALATALIKKDRPVFERLLADDFLMRGEPDVDRDGYIRNALALCWGSTFDLTRFNARVIDATAIVTFTLSTPRDPNTCEPALVRSVITDVWSRTADGWRLQIRQSSPAGGIAEQYNAAAPPPPRWERQAEISLIATGGNTHTETLGSGGTLVYRPGVWQTDARLSYVRSVQEEVETAESLTAEVRESRALTSRADAFARAMYLIDRFAGLDHKTTVDAGLSWKVLTTTPHALALDAGAGVTHEARRDAADRTFGIGTLGASYDWQFTKRNAFTERLLFTGALEDGSNWRLSSTAAISASMTRVLSLKLTHELQYVHEPVPGFRPTDTRLSAALVVKF